MIFEPDGYTNHQALTFIMLIIYISEQNGGHGWIGTDVSACLGAVQNFCGYNPQNAESQIVKEGAVIDESFLLLCYVMTQDVFDFLKFATTIGR